MAAFATPTELASLLQRDLDTATAELVLDMASNAIREDVDQQIDLVEDDQVTLDPPNIGPLLLPELPVVAVSTIILDGVTLVEDTDYTWSPGGIIRRYGTTLAGTNGSIAGWSWGRRARSAVVTYSHGYVADSRQLKVCHDVCLQAAARAYIQPDQAISTSTTVGAVLKSRSYAGGPGAGRIELTDYERRQLDRLRDSL